MKSGLVFEEFSVGDQFRSQGRTITEADVVSFAGLSGDYNPLHTDAQFARETPFGERIAHGMLVAAVGSGLASWMGIFSGTTIALMEQVVQYRGAVKFGDTVYLVLEVLEKKETSKKDRGVVRFASRLFNQDDEMVIDGEWRLLMKRQATTEV